MATKRISLAEGHLSFAHELADLSRAAILPYFRQLLAVENKSDAGGFDPVTAADKAAEHAIRVAIAARYPDHGILGEEFPDIVGSGQLAWVIDPIDGTRAFITGSPLWGTLIGLLDAGRPTIGIMDQPYTRERFWSDGRAASMRDVDGNVHPLQTRPCAQLRDAVLTSTHPEIFSAEEETAAFDRVKGCVRMTRYGGDCYGYCLLAAGFVDIIIEAGLKPHDIVALVPIIESAGGIVTTWDGKSAHAGGRIVACGDRRVHEAALDLLQVA